MNSNTQRKNERPPKSEPAVPSFDDRLKQLVSQGSQDGALIENMKTDGMLMSMANSLSNTKLYESLGNDVNAWADHLLVTKDFKTVIISTDATCDQYLRPVWWIAQIENAKVGNKNYLILLSSYECEQLLPSFCQSKVATLVMYRARLSESHSNLLHQRKLYVTGMDEPAHIDITDEIQIGVYSGSMYFQHQMESNAFCEFLGLILNRETAELKEAFEHGIIQTDGFVPMENRQHLQAIFDCVGQCRFQKSPVGFVIKLIAAQHHPLPKFAHVASILLRGIEPTVNGDRPERKGK